MLEYKNREAIKKDIEARSIIFWDFIEDWRSGDIPEDVFIDEGRDHLKKLYALFETLNKDFEIF